MATGVIEQTEVIKPAGHYIPVLLVHGWRSHPGVWKHLISRLQEEMIPVWVFDHTEYAAIPLDEMALLLRDYIGNMRRETHYSGPVDIVCHSMGTCIARYFLEVLDKETASEQVRQLIGLGPPNNGSAMAELFNHPVWGPRIIDQLTGVFVSKDYNPVGDTIVQQFRPGSITMDLLRQVGIRKDIQYRVILTANKTEVPGFFPPFRGKTWELSGDGKFRTTYFGDGIVSHSDSIIKGATV